MDLKVLNHYHLGAVFQLRRVGEFIQPCLRKLRVKRVLAVLHTL